MSESNANRGWRHYWRDNRLAACAPDNPDAAAAIEQHWRAFFAALPTGTRVLDIATGNGVLPLWAVQAARGAGRSLSLTGVDLADIDPTRYVAGHRDDLAAVRFLGNTAAESLPFADASFDVVVSQYGLEYADLAPAIAEAARVLAPGGHLHLLAHGEGSAVVEQGRAQLADIELLLADGGPFAAMGEFLEANERQRKVARATRRLTDALKAAEAYCAESPPATIVRQLCGGILDTANSLPRYRPADVRQWLDDNRLRLVDQRLRVRDLLAASLTPARRGQIEALLGTAPWRDCALQPLGVGSDGGSVGVGVTARRRTTPPA